MVFEGDGFGSAPKKKKVENLSYEGNNKWYLPFQKLKHIIWVNPETGCSTLYGTYILWCENNCKGLFRVVEVREYDKCIARFSNKDDAAFFKLTWG